VPKHVAAIGFLVNNFLLGLPVVLSIVNGAAKHNNFYETNSDFAEFHYMFLPIRPSSGEFVTKIYKEGRINIVKGPSRS
jgi:hypothetical protein